MFDLEFPPILSLNVQQYICYLGTIYRPHFSTIWQLGSNDKTFNCYLSSSQVRYLEPQKLFTCGKIMVKSFHLATVAQSASTTRKKTKNCLIYVPCTEILCKTYFCLQSKRLVKNSQRHCSITLNAKIP